MKFCIILVSMGIFETKYCQRQLKKLRDESNVIWFLRALKSELCLDGDGCTHNNSYYCTWELVSTENTILALAAQQLEEPKNMIRRDQQKKKVRARA